MTVLLPARPTFDSPFNRRRAGYRPRYPAQLEDPRRIRTRSAGRPEPTGRADELPLLEGRFARTWGRELLDLHPCAEPAGVGPLRVAVVFSGGPAPGGHNVVSGIHDSVRALDSDSRVLGIRGGLGGLLADRVWELPSEDVDAVRNSGGFDLLGSGRDKLETDAHFERCHEVLRSREIDALAVVGGDDSNTNAALLAEYLLARQSDVRVVGVPKTIDGDLRNVHVETSFGFDTAVRVYASLISNLCRDAVSAHRYWHFVRLMGRSASHVTLEAAFQTRPNVALISEEIHQRGIQLQQVVDQLAETIVARAERGLDYGVVLIPEGLIEALPDMRALILRLNRVMGEHRAHFESLGGFTDRSEWINGKLDRDTSYTFSCLPIDIQRGLLMDRDPHGNVQVSHIETERLLIEMLDVRLRELRSDGRYSGSFRPQRHFLGYEGRCAAPTDFDADYAYALGRTAVALVANGATGYMATIANLTAPPHEWVPRGVPLTSLMTLETRHGRMKPVIEKGLVDLDGVAFREFAARRDGWALEDRYRVAAPVQYFTEPHESDRVPFTLQLARMGAPPEDW